MSIKCDLKNYMAFMFENIISAFGEYKFEYHILPLQQCIYNFVHIYVYEMGLFCLTLKIVVV